ncbi:MAG: AAA domain-containing protein [Metamycoplasmataceae bacterium]
MKKAIKHKLLNLITINPIDYCIKTSLTNKHIDILKYVKKDAFLAFINKETDRLEISAASGVAYFEVELSTAKNVDKFIDIILSNGFIISTAMIKSLNDNFSTNKTKVISHFVSEMKSSKKIFLAINKTAKQFYNDSAIWPLHITYQFLKGRLGDNVAIKAPLIIQKVEIVEESAKLILKRIDDEIIVNEKLCVVLNKEYKTNMNSNELLKPLPFNETLKRFGEMAGYEITYTPHALESFMKEDTKELIEKYSILNVESSTVLGFFEPGGSALKQDLEKIIDENLDPFESQVDGNFKPSKYYEDQVVKESDILEINRPLNIFQKYAVASALKQSTLIYGPPGTGKSEVISNIISNALIKGKNVLMVSEKRAALDVLTSRINSLSQFTLYLCDNRNASDFYNKIASLNTILGTQWYREPSRYTRNAVIEPLKMDKNEMIFFNNYQDWYSELVTLVKKHWSIEDYNDNIFNLDYSKYQELKNEIGEQVSNEWLSNIFIEGFGNTTIYQVVNNFLVEYNISKIDDFFDEYLKYKKFVKKFKLEDEFTPNEIMKQIKKIKHKISTNIKLVEYFLLGGKKLISVFEEFFEFKTKYENIKEYQDFMDKTQKQKYDFLERIHDYISFTKKLFAKKAELTELPKQELIRYSMLCEEFKEKYKKEINKYDWLLFLRENGRKVEKFLNEYNESINDTSKAEIIFAEFVTNKKVINDINNCELPLKLIKSVSKNMNEIVDMFNEFIKNIDILESEFVEDFVEYREFFSFDNAFLLDLDKVKSIFSSNNQLILKEWSWLSIPYIKTLYLENFTMFDLASVGEIMKLISAPITQDQFTKLKTISLWNDIVKEIPMFLEIKGIHLQDIITQLRKEAIRSSSIVEELIFKKYVNSLRNYLIKLSKDEKDEIANVLRIASSGTYPSITQFVKRYYESLKKLFPVWVCRPDNVSDMIPLRVDEFYYGIFDEASQMSIERSYPLVYRCKVKVVSGDDKQLKPSSFFMSKGGEGDFDLDDFDAAESLLERAKVSWWNEFHLKNHYRSDSKELIEFSNKFIYNNNLEVATKCGIIEKGIEVYDVEGTWNQMNKEEADMVIDLLIKHHGTYEKILVVTFNSKQSQLIENLLIEKSTKFPELLKEKIENNSIIITNLENVQGNEGDLVILSISYGKNEDGIIKNNFGPLNAKGGSNRLNVAITRARSKMIVVKSMKGNEIKVSNVNNKNAIIFKKFIEYLDATKANKSIEIVNSEMENIDEINEGTMLLNLEKANDKVKIDDLDFTSAISKNIYGDLIKNLSSKYEIQINIKVGSKKIDLLILDKKSKKILKALLIEKWKTNRSVKEMIEEIDRQYFLEDRGYSIFKIKEYEWNIDKIKLIEKIKSSLVSDASQLDYIIWQSEK